jgi:FG-GAP-like repeat
MRAVSDTDLRVLAGLVSVALALASCSSGGASPAGTGGAGAAPTGAAGTPGAAGAMASAGTAGATGAAGATGGAGSMTGAAGAISGGAGAAPDGGAAGAPGAAGAGGAAGHIVMGSLTFTKMTLHMFNYGEGIGTGDFNNDGHTDVHSGPFWWEGPDFTKRHQLFPPPANNGYTDMTLGDWADYSYDVDGDGWMDSINIMRPGTPSYWYKNPGAANIGADIYAWQKNLIGTLVLEQSAFTDLTGGGKPQLVCAIDSKFGWMDVTPSGPWTFTEVGPCGATDAYAWWHGIGVGDLDGDGKNDLITDSFWYTRPAAGVGAGLWSPHAQKFKGDGVADDHGPSQMYGYDVDGDGDQDVITALDSHGYGVAWYENQGNNKWAEHVIVGGVGSMATNAGMIPPFSQPHALVVADIDGDGLEDIVTGKSFYAHPPGQGDPDVDGTPVFYVFKLVRGAGGGAASVTWEPHLVDSVVGLGRQFAVGDLNGDRKVDIAVASKHGVFLFFQQ